MLLVIVAGRVHIYDWGDDLAEKVQELLIIQTMDETWDDLLQGSQDLIVNQAR